tara:strand:- start:737 stop:1303 length:567 start_codon:yes stop_codon:yes gene_type:complete
MNKLQLIFVSLLLTISFSSFAQVGIGTNTPDASAALDIYSTTRGLLPPRMKAFDRDAINTPKQGLIIFCTDCALEEGELQIKLTSGWKNIIGGNVNDPNQQEASKTGTDSNLGATQVATSTTDAASYVDLHQWGRAKDAREIRIPITRTTTARSAKKVTHKVYKKKKREITIRRRYLEEPSSKKKEEN